MRIRLTTIISMVALIGLSIMYNSRTLAQSPGTLYGSTGDAGDTLIIIDPATGTGTALAPHGTFGPVTEIEFRSDGVLYGSTGAGTSNIITIDPVTGIETLVGMHTTGSVNGLEFDDSDLLLGSFFNGSSTNLVSVNQGTGQLTTIGATGVMAITGLAFDQAGVLYAVGHSGGASSLYTINTVTGDASLIGDIGFDAVGALEFGPNGTLYGGVGTIDQTFAGYLITIDPSTGAGTTVGPTGYPGISGLAFYPQPTSIDSNTETIPDRYSLQQNYPNPFNPSTSIKYTIGSRQLVSLKVYDVLGKEIATLVNEEKPAGSHTVEFDASNLSSGIYMYRIQAGEFTQMKKMVLMK